MVHGTKPKKTTSGHFARGTVTRTYEDGFAVSRNIIKRERNIEEKVKIEHRFKESDYNLMEKPVRGTQVLMSYYNLKSKEGKYPLPQDNLPFEVRGLGGRLYYRNEKEFSKS